MIQGDLRKQGDTAEDANRDQTLASHQDDQTGIEMNQTNLQTNSQNLATTQDIKEEKLTTKDVAQEGISMKTEDKSENFGKAVQYWLSIIGYAVGYGNLWRFPFLLYDNGGGAFMIPYLLCLLFIAVPMFVIETAFGQTFRTILSERYMAVHPRLWGFSYANLFVCAFFNLYYTVLMAWTIAYLILSFQSPLPWDSTEHLSSGDSSSFFNSDFFQNDLLKASSSIDTGDSGLVWLIVIGLFVSYFLVYFAIWKGVESSGKIVYITAPLPYVILLILLVKALTLGGASKGLKFLFVPDWEKLKNFKVWSQAVNQIIFSSGVGFGPLVFYGACRKQDEKIVTSSVILPFINSFTSIFAAIVLFSFLGHISEQLNVEIDQIVSQGIQLAFVAYPAMLTTLPGANFWSIIFFIMLITVGIDSIFATFDFMSNFIYNEFPGLKTRLRKEIFALILCLTYFIIGLMFCSHQGLYLFKLFDHYSVGLPLLFSLVAEIIIICFIFNIKKLERLMKESTGENLPCLIKWVTMTVTFVFALVAFVGSFIAEFSNPLELPWWGLLLGWVLMMFPILVALVGICLPKKYFLCCFWKYAAINQPKDQDLSKSTSFKKTEANKVQPDDASINA